jgi:4-hydroxy-4-methyl-2-oxoglutarate aldolase
MDGSVDRLSRLSLLDTCAVSDALDGLGLSGALVGLQPLWPLAGVVAGRVRTLRVGPRTPGGPTVHLGTPLIAAARPGDVIVIDAGGRSDVSSWGGILSAAAVRAGIRAVVVDGACRDIADSEELGLPIFGRAVVPVSARGRVVQLSMDEPVGLCGHTVRSGGYAIADRCGVVVIPEDGIGAVLDLAERIRDREAEMVAAVHAGRPVVDVMHDSRFPEPS